MKFKCWTDFSVSDLHTLCENHLKKSTTAVAFLLSKEESVFVEESSTETVTFSGQQRVTQVWKNTYFPSTLSLIEESIVVEECSTKAKAVVFSSQQCVIHVWKKWGL